MSLQEAVEAPRVWTEGGVLELESRSPMPSPATFRARSSSLARQKRIAAALTPSRSIRTARSPGAACWRADGTPVAISGGLARAGVRSPSPDKITSDVSQPMPETIVVLDRSRRARRQAPRAAPPGFVSPTHGARRRSPERDHADADYAISGQVRRQRRGAARGAQLKLLHKWASASTISTPRRRASSASRSRAPRPVTPCRSPNLRSAYAVGAAPYRVQHAQLQKGDWRIRTPAGDTFTLSGKTVGIVGFRRHRHDARAGCSRVRLHDPLSKRQPLDAGEEAALGVKHAALADLLAQSDVVSLHCPLTPQTANMIDKAAFATIEEDRGPDQCGVRRHRQGERPDRGAAYQRDRRRRHGRVRTEPLPPGSPLLGIDHLVVTRIWGPIASDVFVPTCGGCSQHACVSRARPCRNSTAWL